MRFLPTIFAALAFTGLAAAADPTLDAVALDGIRMCQSMAEGRAPAEAATIFGFAPSEALFVHETAQGKVEVLPPAADRRSCRIQLYALTLDNKVVIDAVAAFVTTPPQAYAPLQSRIAERIGDYAARTSIWAQSGGGTLAMLTLYEILANEYYLGPKVLIDFVLEKR